MTKVKELPSWLILAVVLLWVAVIAIDGILIFDFVHAATGNMTKAIISGLVSTCFSAWIMIIKVNSGGKVSCWNHHLAYWVLVAIATGFLSFVTVKDQLLREYSTKHSASPIYSAPNDWALFLSLPDASWPVISAFVGLLLFFCFVVWMVEEMLSKSGDRNRPPFDGSGLF